MKNGDNLHDISVLILVIAHVRKRWNANAKKP